MLIYRKKSVGAQWLGALLIDVGEIDHNALTYLLYRFIHLINYYP